MADKKAEDARTPHDQWRDQHMTDAEKNAKQNEKQDEAAAASAVTTGNVEHPTK